MMLLIGLGGVLVGAVVGVFSVLVAGRVRARRGLRARRADRYVDDAGGLHLSAAARCRLLDLLDSLEAVRRQVAADLGRDTAAVPQEKPPRPRQEVRALQVQDIT